MNNRRSESALEDICLMVKLLSGLLLLFYSFFLFYFIFVHGLANFDEIDMMHSNVVLFTLFTYTPYVIADIVYSFSRARREEKSRKVNETS
jgi:hypothetical protein